MKKLNGFTQLESIKEISDYIDDLVITREVNRLQVHHMDLPNYDCWTQDKKRWGDLAALKRTLSLNEYGKLTWGSGAYDGHGHYIAQHFNVFPDGTVTTGRHIDSTPIGIKGWNTSAICVEIYGDFDKGQDKMTSAQKEAVSCIYYKFTIKLKLDFTSKYIRPHAWFTSGGTNLGTYDPVKSRKTCPGTNFFGLGNTKEAFDKFYSILKNYDFKGEIAPVSNSADNTLADYSVITKTSLNIRTGPSTSYSKVGTYSKGLGVKLIAVNQDLTWGKTDKGWVSIKEFYVQSPSTKLVIKNVSGESVNVREEPNFTSEVSWFLLPEAMVDFEEAIVREGTDMYKTTEGHYITASAKYTRIIRVPSKRQIVKNTSSTNLNLRTSLDWDAEPVAKLSPGDSLTYVEGPLEAKNGSTKMFKTLAGTYITASSKYISLIEI